MGKDFRHSNYGKLWNTFIYWQYVTLHMCALIGASRKLAKITDGCHGYIMSTDPQCQQELQLLGSCLLRQPVLRLVVHTGWWMQSECIHKVNVRSEACSES